MCDLTASNVLGDTDQNLAAAPDTTTRAGQDALQGKSLSFDPEVSLRAALRPETQCRRKRTQCEAGPKGRMNPVCQRCGKRPFVRANSKVPGHTRQRSEPDGSPRRRARAGIAGNQLGSWKVFARANLKIRPYTTLPASWCTPKRAFCRAGCPSG